MCGRYENKISLDSLLETLGLDITFYNEIKKRFTKKENIAPTDLIINISHLDGKFVIDISNWGIKFKADSPLIFNSRIETINEKSYWKSLFKNNKCLVPMTGFYEWKKSGKKKIPYKIFLPDEEIFFVPALSANVDNQKFISLITTEPNNFMKDIHNRMPVILNKVQVKDFFNNDVEANIELCKPLEDFVNMSAIPAVFLLESENYN